MKKNDWILTISVVLYSFLFYKQSLGINFLFFNLFVVASLLIRDRELLKNKYWIITAIASIVSSVCILLYGNLLSFFANFFSLSLLSVLSINKNSSVFLALFYSLSSFASSIVFIIIDFVERRRKRITTVKTGVFTKILIGVIIFIVLLLFFFLYQKSNPLFYNFTKDINLDFITAAWIFFTLGGLLLMYGFYYPLKFNNIHQRDVSNSNLISEKSEEEYNQSKWRKFFSFSVELSAGTILFLLLNMMLIILNILDINYLWINKVLPDGLTYADYVHQGIGTLIMSIIFAIIVILFFFRSQINYYKNNKVITLLVYFWILQNIMMVVSTAYRNLLYVNEYSLTYKRIGVYVYLLLAFIGLSTTLLKIGYKKSNWYLFRKNAWAAFFVLIIAAFINWDLLITRFNIEKSKQVDVNYLVGLSYKNLPILLSHKFNENDLSIKDNEIFDYKPRQYNNNKYSDDNYYNDLHRKLFMFLENYNRLKWQSYCVSKQQVYNEILTLEKSGKIDSLVLQNCNIENLTPIKGFVNLKSLNLNNDRVRKMNELSYFKKLSSLQLANNQIDSLEQFPVLNELKDLNLRNNVITNIDPLLVLTSLEKLDISTNKINDVRSFPKFKNLKSLNISGNTINDLAPFIEMKKLKSLDLSYSPLINLKTLPVIPSLSELYLNNNQITAKNIEVLWRLSEYKNLTGLYLSGNELENLNFILIYIDNRAKLNMLESPIFGNLQILDVSNCSLTNIYSVKYIENLMELNVSFNKLNEISSIESLKNLEVLNVSSNGIDNLKSISELENLLKLNVSSNHIDSVPHLKSFNSLLELNASHNQIFCITSLSKLKNIGILDLNNNNIIDISALSNLKSLESLNLMNNPIKDYSPLFGLKQLKKLYIANASKEQLEKLKQALPKTKIETEVQKL